MATITISGGSPQISWPYPGTTATLRYTYSADFVNSANEPVLRTLYKDVPCTVSGGVLSYPSHSIFSTLDALVNPLVTLNALFLDARGAKRAWLFQNFQIPSSPSPTTIGALKIYNQGSSLVLPPATYLSLPGVQALINIAVGLLLKASDVIYGLVRLSVAPASASAPIAVGDNDVRVTADQATNVASIRTIGTGALQAMAGNDPRVGADAPLLLIADYVGNGALAAGLIIVKPTGIGQAVRTSLITDTGNAVGIGVSGGTNTVTFAQGGKVTAIFDAVFSSGATSNGHFVQISLSQAGCCTTSGATYPTSGQVIGKILAANVGDATAVIEVFAADVRGNNNLGASVHYASEFASLSAAVTSIGSTPATLVVSTASFPSGGTTSVPATLVLDFSYQPGSLLLGNGHIVTVLSDSSEWPLRKIFYNALSGQGTVAFTASKYLPPLLPQWWGAIPSPPGITSPAGTDVTSELRAAMMAFETRSTLSDDFNRLSAGCGDMYFAAGDYWVGTGLTTGSVLTMTKAGALVGERGARIYTSGLDAAVDILTINPGAGVAQVFNYPVIQIRNLILGYDAGPFGRYGINITLPNNNMQMPNFLLENTWVGSTNNFALRISSGALVGGMARSKIVNCRFAGGVQLDGVGDTIVFDGIQIANPRDNTLGPLTVGLEINLVNGATGPYVNNMNFTHNGGIWVRSGQGGCITNSIVEMVGAGATGHNGAEIDLDGGGSAALVDFKILNVMMNSQAGSNLDGVRINAATNAVLSGNSYNQTGVGKAAVNITASAVNPSVNATDEIVAGAISRGAGELLMLRPMYGSMLGPDSGYVNPANIATGGSAYMFCGGFQLYTAGANLSIAGNAITVTNVVHRVVGGGLIKNINAGTGTTPAAVIYLTADGSGFTMDNTGNVEGPVNAAANATVVCIRHPDNLKWSCK